MIEARATIEKALQLVEPKDLVVASSFGLEDVTLIHMFVSREAPVRYITLDTGRLHEDTYKTMETIRQKYGIKLETYFPKVDDVEALVRGKGFYSFRESIEERKYCCKIRKLEPLSRALAGAKGWVCGLRREQSPTRSQILNIERDEAHKNIYKFNPLTDWTFKDVWNYVKKHDIPYNPLHDQGFPSIGCAPCTRAVEPGEDGRAGRWWWESPEHKECGLHLAHKGRKK